MREIGLHWFGLAPLALAPDRYEKSIWSTVGVLFVMCIYIQTRMYFLGGLRLDGSDIRHLPRDSGVVPCWVCCGF